MNEAPGTAPRDASWVIIDTPLSMPALRSFCTDIERLLRINPYLEFSMWHQSAPESHHAKFFNLSNQQQVALDIRIERESDDAFTLIYRQGVKRCTRFALEPVGAGSRLTITDDYALLPPAEREQRLDEVDRSLTAWGWALHEYLKHEQRWGRFAPWRWYMRRWWLPMKPGARRITYMLVWLTLAELVFVLLVAVVYWAASAR